MTKLGVFALCALGTVAQAEEPFVESNLLGIFYHELGHALIDTEGLQVLGQEEDAADVFSILLIDALYEEDSALALAYDVSDGFWGEALARDRDDIDVAWWDVHGPDEQRFYNTVCLFYGADPDQRGGFAADMELPQERADYCPEEFDQAYGSWSPVLDKMAARKDGVSLEFVADEDSLTAQLILSEVEALNGEFQFAQPLRIIVEPCGEANAFYDPEASEIVMCREFEDHLRDLRALLEQ